MTPPYTLQSNIVPLVNILPGSMIVRAGRENTFSSVSFGKRLTFSKLYEIMYRLNIQTQERSFTMMQSRTHNCGELRLSDAGKSVTIVGWLENVREVGSNFAFCVLRDYYGTTQVVIENEEMMSVIKPLNKETTISVTGVVRERESKNTKIPTGEIEVVPEKIEVLGKCIHNQLPFEINKSKDANEDTRLKYRFLDLRNPAVKSNIILRCQVVAELRRLMTEKGFLEITTPILTASSPEGARDYLVPARNHPGKFYALPQAPQQF